MNSYDYVVAWWPTQESQADITEEIARGGTIKKVFNDPVAASAYAMEHGWFPFVVERIERGD